MIIILIGQENKIFIFLSTLRDASFDECESSLSLVSDPPFSVAL